MAPVQPPAKVLVTGANGFIGAWIVRAFLEQNYDVRGTVRSKGKGEWLASQAWVKAASGHFEYVIVSDIEAPGAFDQAVQGDISVVVHAASPVVIEGNLHPDDLINPAVGGTIGILDSIVKHAPAVRRFVLTASVTTISEPTQKPRVFTEEDWNNVSVKEIEAKGIAAESMHKYRASKVKAEKAAWEFLEKSKGKLNFDMITIHPPFVYGPIIHEVSSADKLNASLVLFYNHLRKEVPLAEASYSNFVDVRDVAQMHVDVARSGNAVGRFIASGGSYFPQEIYDALNSQPNPLPGVFVGTPGARGNGQPLVQYSTEKARRVLGTKFTPLKDTAYDTLVSLQEQGFWP